MRLRLGLPVAILLLAAARAAYGSSEGSSAPPADKAPSSARTMPHTSRNPTSTVGPTLTETSAEKNREALVALYNASGGENWGNRDRSISNDSVGRWEGVATDGDERVILLDLSGNFLSGEIPSEFGNLTMLSRLDLSSGWLGGEILPDLGRLANPVGLDLSNNQMRCCAPERLKQQLDRDLSDLGGLPFCEE